MDNNDLSSLGDDGLVRLFRESVVTVPATEAEGRAATKRECAITEELHARGEASFAKLLSLLADPDPRIRLATAIECQSRAHDKAGSVLRQLLKDPDPRIAGKARIYLTFFDKTYDEEERAEAEKKYGKALRFPDGRLGRKGSTLMPKGPPSGLSDDELVQLFREMLVLAENSRLDDEDRNELIEQTRSIVDELQSRGDAAVAKLLPLLDDASEEVRLGAARNCMSLDQARCTSVLRALAKSRKPGISLPAMMQLANADKQFSQAFQADAKRMNELFNRLIAGKEEQRGEDDSEAKS